MLQATPLEEDAVDGGGGAIGGGDGGGGGARLGGGWLWTPELSLEEEGEGGEAPSPPPPPPAHPAVHLPAHADLVELADALGQISATRDDISVSPSHANRPSGAAPAPSVTPPLARVASAPPSARQSTDARPPHAPTAPTAPPAWRGILGLSDAEAFEAWCTGRTGAPLVDAGMVQLWACGWMPRRIRLLCAACLVEGFGLDWRLGRDWFAYALTDHDFAINEVLPPPPCACACACVNARVHARVLMRVC